MTVVLRLALCYKNARMYLHGIYILTPWMRRRGEAKHAYRLESWDEMIFLDGWPPCLGQIVLQI